MINSPCVYMLVNKKNGKRYIGQTMNPTLRFYQHRMGGKHAKGPIARAFRKHGKDSFRMVILKKCLPGDLLAEEFKFIAKMKPEYNHMHRNANADSKYYPGKRIRSVVINPEFYGRICRMACKEGRTLKMQIHHLFRFVLSRRVHAARMRMEGEF